ncbi:MAG: spore germination protein [Bacillota bacterium]
MIILGPVKVTAVQSGAQMMQADVNITNTRSSMKMQAAAGSFNMGDFQIINNQLNINGNTQFDPDVVDMPQNAII